MIDSCRDNHSLIESRGNMSAFDSEKQPAESKTQDYGVAGANPLINADKLARRLSARQVQMIAIGGTIGTGLSSVRVLRSPRAVLPRH